MGLFGPNKKRVTETLILNIIEHKNRLLGKINSTHRRIDDNKSELAQIDSRSKLYISLKEKFGEEKLQRGIKQEFFEGDTVSFVETFLGRPESKHIKNKGGIRDSYEYRYDYLSKSDVNDNLKPQYSLKISFDVDDKVSRIQKKNEGYILRTKIINSLEKFQQDSKDVQKLSQDIQKLSQDIRKYNDDINLLINKIKISELAIDNLRTGKLSINDIEFDIEKGYLHVNKEKLDELKEVEKSEGKSLLTPEEYIEIINMKEPS